MKPPSITKDNYFTHWYRSTEVKLNDQVGTRYAVYSDGKLKAYHLHAQDILMQHMNQSSSKVDKFTMIYETAK